MPNIGIGIASRGTERASFLILSDELLLEAGMLRISLKRYSQHASLEKKFVRKYQKTCALSAATCYPDANIWHPTPARPRRDHPLRKSLQSKGGYLRR